jgi:dTDP-4-amino-4,6-dideoxygalactose transaminase
VYDEMLPESCGRPVVLDNATSIWAQYTIRTATREHQLRNLKQEEIPAMVYYPRPLHRQLPYEGFPIAGECGLPVTDRLAGSVLSLPMHPYLSREEQSRVAAALDRAESAA